MKVIEIKGAEPFLKALSLDNKNINGVLLKPIFRGQSDANWAALPSAYRDDGNLLLDRKLYPLGVRTNREQIEAEFYTLSLLVDELNQNGFHVPNEEILNLDTNSNEFNEFITKIGRGESIWPPKKYHSLMSIAQHYGMPTRLLDFTYDPYVALYFAVKGVLEGVNSDYLAVYVVNKFNPKLTGYDFIENYESDGLYKKTLKTEFIKS